MFYIIGKTYTKDGLCYKVLDTDDMQSVIVSYSSLVETIKDNTPMRNAILEGFKIVGTDYNLDNLGEVGSEDLFIRVNLGKEYVYVSQNERVISNRRSIKKYKTIYDLDKLKTKIAKLKVKIDETISIKVGIEEYKDDKILRVYGMNNVYSKILHKCSTKEETYEYYYAIYEVYELSEQIFELLTLDSEIGSEPYIGVLVRYNHNLNRYDEMYIIPNPSKGDIQNFGSLCESMLTRILHENKTYTEKKYKIVNKVL